MANQEHLDILKQGVDVWNAWRKQHREIRPDLSEVDLSEADLSKFNFQFTSFFITNLSGNNLKGANLNVANLNEANLSGANLSGAILSASSLIQTNLDGANLSRANLTEVYLMYTKVSGTNFHEAMIGGTTFGNVDLRLAKGLETIRHLGPSTIGTNTLAISEGGIPEAFLRGAGLPDTFITYVRSLVGKPIDYYSCFISYSSKDQEFVERLYADLQSRGVRCWFAPEDLKIGDKIRDRIDQSIRVHDKLLLVLSEHSVNSSWVEFEVEAAFAKEASRMWCRP